MDAGNEWKEGTLKYWNPEKDLGYVIVLGYDKDVLTHKDVIKDYEKLKDRLVPGVRIKVLVETRYRASEAEIILQ